MTERQKISLQWEEYLFRQLIIGHVKFIAFVQACILVVASIVFFLGGDFYLLPNGIFLIVQLINLCITYFEEKP